jgi:hypothetical protein
LTEFVTGKKTHACNLRNVLSFPWTSLARESQFIWFGWRDDNGAQHQKSTETSDPAKALLVKMKFLEDQKEKCEESYTEGPDLQRESP